jgi:hypothetical protein
MSPIGPLHRATDYLASRHGALLVALLALLATYPFAGTRRTAGALLELCWALVLLSLVRAVWHQRATRRLVLLLGAAAVVAGALASQAKLLALYPVVLALRVVLLAVIVVGLFRNLLERRRITMDAVLGACCIYLLFGIGWSGIYSLIRWVDPAAFQFAGASHEATEVALVYFSLITMTTVGHGDITPVSGPARMIAAIEALLAQLFLAIVIARMVAMELVHRDQDPPS